MKVTEETNAEKYVGLVTMSDLNGLMEFIEEMPYKTAAPIIDKIKSTIILMRPEEALITMAAVIGIEKKISVVVPVNQELEEPEIRSENINESLINDIETAAEPEFASC